MQIIRKAPQAQEKAAMIGAQRLQEFCGRKDGLSCGNKGYEERDFGLAVDIGTTTLAISLYRLETKEFVGSMQQRNRQTRLGRDVMMRLMHCQRGQQEILRNMLIEQLEQLAETLSEGICFLCDIKEMTVVGNPAMCHIFTGKDISGLAGNPFKPSYRGALSYIGDKLGFVQLSQIRVYILAGIDAHVGADAVSMMTVLGMGQQRKVQMAIDIGTNAEIALQDIHGNLMTCSVPAGPAFEGMEISCGMSGETGAIAGIRFAPQTGNVILDVIDNRHNSETDVPIPRGVCGSGLIDAVAQLLQFGLLTRDGYLLSAQEASQSNLPEYLAERLVESNGQRGFVLYGMANEQGRAVILTQQDIRQFQLAKAAVQAGIKALLSSQKVLLKQVEQIWIAGVFGGHISKSSAVKTGVFPPVSLERLSVVGNAAGEGAALALLSAQFRQSSEQLAQEAGHLELATSAEFQREFLVAMQF